MNHSKENLLIGRNGEIYENVINRNYKCDLSQSTRMIIGGVFLDLVVFVWLRNPR